MSASLWLQSLGSFLVKLCGTISLISTITCTCIKTRRSHRVSQPMASSKHLLILTQRNWHPLTTISHMLIASYTDCRLAGITLPMWCFIQ